MGHIALATKGGTFPTSKRVFSRNIIRQHGQKYLSHSSGGSVGLLFTYLNAQWVARREIGTDRMKRISTYITDGAMAFLRAEYSKLFYFVVIVAAAGDTG